MQRPQSSNTYLYNLMVMIIAVGFGLLHRWHVATLFENDRYFSHLSEIEREMSFRTEMGLYYSYYKTITNSNTYSEGIEKIRRDNLSQYDHVIDALRTYNLVPEMYAGFLYHTGKSLGLIGHQKCWQVERGDRLPPVTSCEGSGVPMYFYLECVWICAAATATILFFYSVLLSDTAFGGIITLLGFFYNHKESTRVQWTPPLRESFAYPALLFQMYQVSRILKDYKKSPVKEVKSWKDLAGNFDLDLAVATVMCLQVWQFSQFVFLTQMVALLILKWTKVIPQDVFIRLLVSHNIALLLSFFTTKFTFCSLYMFLLIACNFCAFLSMKVLRHFKASSALLCEILSVIVTTHLLKKHIRGFGDDEHVYNILRAKLSDYKDFHTMLYTCAPEFDFLHMQTYMSIVRTLVLPIAILSGIVALYHCYRTFRIQDFPKCVEAHVAYNALQTGAFIIMAVFVMRLKLFMTPHLCIIAGLASSKRYLEKIGIKGEYGRISLVVLLIAGMSYHGIENIKEERSFEGEYVNVEQEELFEWIKGNTAKNAAFAGQMSLMANLMLSTERPIVNNPYYEDKEMRERTLKVYEIFSRKEVASVYVTLKQLKVNYVILEETICYGLGFAKEGCQMLDLWDMVDQGEGIRTGRRSVCPILYRGNAHPFKRVFMNDRFVVLRLDDSQYVELKPKPTTIPVITLESPY